MSILLVILTAIAVWTVSSAINIVLGRWLRPGSCNFENGFTFENPDSPEVLLGPVALALNLIYASYLVIGKIAVALGSLPIALVNLFQRKEKKPDEESGKERP